MSEKKGKGKISVKTSGKGYENVWLYLPSKIAKDSSFPFLDKEEVNVEIKEGQLIVSKRDTLRELIRNYGIENATLPYLIETKAKENRNKPFILFKNEIYSYQETHEWSNRIAHGILQLIEELDLKKHHIAVILPNSPEFIFSWFGIVKAGRIFIPINRFLKGGL